MLNRNAFTIIELMIVLSVLGIIIAIALPSIKGMQASAIVVQVKHDLKTYQAALENYYTFNNAYPVDAYANVSSCCSRSIQNEFLISATPQMISSVLYDPNLVGTVAPGGEYFYGISPNGQYYIIGSVGCFVTGTNVLLANGKWEPIENLKIGDLLSGAHGAHNKVLKRNVMPRKFWRLYAFNGGRYFVTENHVFRTKDGWKAIDPNQARKDSPQLNVGKLNNGDELVTIKGYVRLNKIESKVIKDAVVYNPSLDGSHDYYAVGYLVHNNNMATAQCGGPDFHLKVTNTGYNIVDNADNRILTCVTNLPNGGC